MKVKAGSLLIVALALILITSAVLSAFASQLDTLLVPKRDKAEARYKSIGVIYIEYPNGGELQSMLQNAAGMIEFTADRDTPGVQELINEINSNLRSGEKKSPVTVEDIKVDYKSALKADERRAVLEQSLKLDILITGFVLDAGSASEGTLIDLNWRGFHVDEPIVLKTEEYGDVEINLPSGYLYAKKPEFMQAMEGTEGMKLLTRPAIDFREFTDLSIDRWHWLYDPSGSIEESERFGFKEVEGANVVTFFAFGEGSIREGIHKPTTMKVDVAVDGVQYVLRSTSPASSASIQITGYATESIQGLDEGALVFESVPEGAGKSYTGGFPIMVLVALGGMMVVISGFVLWRANKK